MDGPRILEGMVHLKKHAEKDLVGRMVMRGIKDIYGLNSK